MLTFLSLSFALVAQTERNNKHKDNQNLLSYQYKDSLFKTFALFDSVQMKTTKIYNQYYERGRRLMTFKDSAKKALEMFDSALVFNPKSAEAYHWRGKIKIDFGLFKDGLNDYDAAIKVADIKQKLFYFQRKEQIFYLNKKIDSFVSITDKLSTYNDAIAMFPDTFRVYFDRSQFYQRIKDYKHSIADAKKVIILNEPPHYYYLLTDLMEESKVYDDAAILQVYDDAIKKAPTRNKSWSYESRASYYEKKAKSFESKLNNDSVETNYNRIMYYQKALRDYDTAKALITDDKKRNLFLLLNARIRCMVNSHLFSQQIIIDEYTNNINDKYDWVDMNTGQVILPRLNDTRMPSQIWILAFH